MKISVLCEFSGIVRDAFTKKGHDATSYDLLPTESPGKHIIGDIFDPVIYKTWIDSDIIIAHPPCTYLCNSGVRWLKTEKGRMAKMEEAARFFKKILNSGKRICVENPVMHKYALAIIGQNYTQTIQPWQFGHPESKRTCLWLRGLPELAPTSILPKQKRWNNQTPTGQNNLGPSKNRWKLRSATYQGVADALAKQYG